MYQDGVIFIIIETTTWITYRKTPTAVMGDNSTMTLTTRSTINIT